MMSDWVGLGLIGLIWLIALTGVEPRREEGVWGGAEAPYLKWGSLGARGRPPRTQSRPTFWSPIPLLGEFGVALINMHGE